jgi:hypothetical protein
VPVLGPFLVYCQEAQAAHDCAMRICLRGRCAGHRRLARPAALADQQKARWPFGQRAFVYTPAELYTKLCLNRRLIIGSGQLRKSGLSPFSYAHFIGGVVQFRSA